MDDELSAEKADAVRMHIAACDQCAVVFEDLASIFDVCRIETADELAPPNSPALWRRISNVIESETKPVPIVEAPRRRIWRFTIPQLATAVLGIAVISSLLTVVGLRNYNQPSGDDVMTRASSTQTTFERFMGRLGLIDTPRQARDRRVKQQQAAIDYWNSRVAMRRAQWTPRTREAFDRNMHVIDQSVAQYTELLDKDPEDDLSSEMLDSVMTDKMNLLRDFSDL